MASLSLGTSPNAMPLEEFVAQTMRGLEKGEDEIAAGLGKILGIGSRLAPNLIIIDKKRKAFECHEIRNS